MRGLADIGYIIATLVGFLVVVGVSWIVLSSTIDAFNSVGATSAAEGIRQGKSALTTFGNAMLFVIFTMGVVMLILAYFVRTHPVFFPITFTIGAIFIIIGAVFANFSEEFVNQVDSVTGDFSTAFESLVWLAIKQPLWIGVLIFATLVLTYTGKRIMEAGV